MVDQHILTIGVHTILTGSAIIEDILTHLQPFIACSVEEEQLLVKVG